MSRTSAVVALALVAAAARGASSPVPGRLALAGFRLLALAFRWNQNLPRT